MVFERKNNAKLPQLGAALGVMLNFAAQAASFDCGKAASKVEKLVCDNPVISKLDGELGKTYQDDLHKANEEQKQRLITEQKHWLKYTRNACSNETCFKHAYWSRLAELETFFEPHSPLYKKESDKAEDIKKILAAYQFEGSPSTGAFCRQILDDLRQMKDVDFVDPIVQVQSYEDPALDPWKRQYKGKEPLHFSYQCDARFYRLYKKDMPMYRNELSDVCDAGYGLPPFKLFELPPLQASGEKKYVFYSDDDYGPMNKDKEKPHMGGGSQAGFYIYKLIFSGGKLEGGPWTRGGARNGPNYNSVITYRGQYYLMNLYKEYSYWLDIESVIRKPISVCRWRSPVLSNQGSK